MAHPAGPAGRPPRPRRGSLERRSTAERTAAPGCSSRCRCCSPRSRSRGPRRCRRRRCRRLRRAPPRPSSRRELARHYPDRRPGSAGAAGARRLVPTQLALYGFRAATDALHGDDPRARRGRARNVVGRRPGPLAGRDRRDGAPGQHRQRARRERQRLRNGGAGRARARLRAAPATTGRQRRPAHTLVFVSTDGGAYGGARRSALRRDLAATAARGRGASTSTRRGAGAAATRDRGRRPRSPAASLVAPPPRGSLEQTGSEPRRPGALAAARSTSASRSRSASRGRSSPAASPRITLTTSGDRPASVRGHARAARPQRAGRARPRRRRTSSARSTPGSTRAGRERATCTSASGSSAAGRSSSCSSPLLLPFLVGAVDLFARCRRRRIPLAPACGACRSRLAFWLCVGVLLLVVLALVGVLPTAPPPAPRRRPPPAPTGRVSRSRARRARTRGWLVSRERLIPRRRVDAPRSGWRATRSRCSALGLVALVRRRDQPVCAALPAALAVRLALAAAGGRGRASCAGVCLRARPAGTRARARRSSRGRLRLGIDASPTSLRSSRRATRRPRPACSCSPGRPSPDSSARWPRTAMPPIPPPPSGRRAGRCGSSAAACWSLAEPAAAAWPTCRSERAGPSRLRLRGRREPNRANGVAGLE